MSVSLSDKINYTICSLMLIVPYIYFVTLIVNVMGWSTYSRMILVLGLLVLGIIGITLFNDIESGLLSFKVFHIIYWTAIAVGLFVFYG